MSMDAIEAAAVAVVETCRQTLNSPLKGIPGKTFQFPIWKLIAMYRTGHPVSKVDWLLAVAKSKASVCIAVKSGWDGIHISMHPIKSAIDYADYLIRSGDDISLFCDMYESFIAFLQLPPQR